MTPKVAAGKTSNSRQEGEDCKTLKCHYREITAIAYNKNTLSMTETGKIEMALPECNKGHVNIAR